MSRRAAEVICKHGYGTVQRISARATPKRLAASGRAPRFPQTRGQVLWFGVRKRWFSARVDEAIAAGARQLLVVGAGFDPLATLVADRHHDVLCVEVDAPATARLKHTGVQTSGHARENHVVCAADLALRPLAEVLASTPWRVDRPSIVVAEGLLMYLGAEDVRRFLAALRDCVGTGSRLAASAMDVDGQGRVRLPVDPLLAAPLRLALRLVGEPLRWGIAPAEVPAFLAAHGWRTTLQPTVDDLRAEILAGHGLGREPLAPYEHLVLAERA